MILIIGEENDPTLDEVIRWLNYFDEKLVRINENETVEVVNFEFSNDQISFALKVREDIIDYSKISSVYYRRGIVQISNSTYETGIKNLDFFYQQENVVLTDFIHFLLENKPSIGKFEMNGPNKLKILFEANKVGLKIPKSFIVNDKKSLKKLFEKNRSLITKAIFEPVNFVFNNISVSAPTALINKNDINVLPNNFLHTLYQEQIVKDFEIRVFYLLGEVYSMAILSQSNNKTKIDYRNYDHEKPNRMLPLDLPNDIVLKVQVLMQNLEYSIGCIDFIYNDGDYCFLEVNPVGQYGMVSYPCGYNLEKEVAKKLISIKNV